MDGEDIEDQNARVFVEYVKDKPRTVVKMKIRPDADKKLVELLKRINPDVFGGVPSSGNSGEVYNDVFYQPILEAVKTVNFHVGDGNYNHDKVTKAKGYVEDLHELEMHGTPDEKKLAKHYLEWLKKINDAVLNKTMTGGTFEKYPMPIQAPEVAEGASEKPIEGVTVNVGAVKTDRRSVVKGRVLVTREDVNASQVFGTGREGLQYNIDLGGGVRVTYKPWSDANLYAHGGELEIRVNGTNPDDVTDAIERVKTLGINTDPATRADRELLYLVKTAAVNLEHKNPEYRKLITSLERKKNVTTEERVEALAQYWSKKLGVEDVRALPTYRPEGDYEASYDGKGVEAGMINQRRFDISVEEVRREMADYSVYHGLTNGGTYSEFFEMVLPNSGALVATTEKARIGVPVQGMSPVADMGTGGANYVFTRIWKQPKRDGTATVGLYFKVDLLTRLDAVTYDHDAFGKMTGNYTDKRYSNPDGWKVASKKDPRNETDFKYSITLLDNLEWVVVSSRDEADRCIEAFRKNGITKLPDGRNVGDIFIVGRG